LIGDDLSNFVDGTDFGSFGSGACFSWARNVSDLSADGTADLRGLAFIGTAVLLTIAGRGKLGFFSKIPLLTAGGSRLSIATDIPRTTDGISVRPDCKKTSLL
jgi:hypothetical protein